MLKLNVPDGNYLAYQSGWVVSFYFGKRLITFRAEIEKAETIACEIEVIDGKHTILYS